MKLSTIKRRVITLLVLLPFAGLAQCPNEDLKWSEYQKPRSTFLGITGGIGPSRFRDFATSPLFYDGSSLYLALSQLKSNQKNEFEMGISTSVGSYNTDFNGHNTSSDLYTGSFFYSQLYQLAFLSSQKWKIKAGGLIDFTGSLRQNESFGNNGLGFEIFPTLFGSFKVVRDISRRTEKMKKLLFIKYKLQPVSRTISLRINPGIVNSTFRNGYIYFRHGAVLEENKPFADYQFKFLSGFRMSSAFDYTVHLKNNNRYQLSYLWNVYKTGGELDKYEMAQHSFRVTLFYNIP